MGQQVRVFNIFNRLLLKIYKLKILNPKLSDLTPNQIRKTNILLSKPVSVAKDWGDLGLGVKGLSNLGVAGFPRNLLK